MNKQQAKEIVDACSIVRPTTMRKDICHPKLNLDGLPRNEQYELVYETLDGKRIPEGDYLEAKRVLGPRSKAGRKQVHSELRIGAALGYALAEYDPLNDDHQRLFARVEERYIQIMEGKVESISDKHTRTVNACIKAFLKERNG